MFRERHYFEQLQATVERCRESLERDDLRQIDEVKLAQNVQAEVESFQQGKLSNQSLHALSSIFPFISHLKKFTDFTSSGLSTEGSVSVIWGLLSLVIQVSCSRHCRQKSQ